MRSRPDDPSRWKYPSERPSQQGHRDYFVTYGTSHVTTRFAILGHDERSTTSPHRFTRVSGVSRCYGLTSNSPSVGFSKLRASRLPPSSPCPWASDRTPPSS